MLWCSPGHTASVVLRWDSRDSSRRRILVHPHLNCWCGLTFTLFSLFLFLAHKDAPMFPRDEGSQACWQPQEALLSSDPSLCAVVGPDSSAESVWGRCWVKWRQIWNCVAVSCWKQLCRCGYVGHENGAIVASIYQQQFTLYRKLPSPDCILASLLLFPCLASSVLYRLQERWKFLKCGWSCFRQIEHC